MDHDIQGVLGLRLIDAPPRVRAAMVRRLGPATQLTAPDLTLRFVERVNDRGVAIPFEDLGIQPCEIACERRYDPLPLLAPMLGIVALGSGLVPLHGCGFVWRGNGAVIAGPAYRGKTGALLAFLKQGASLVGDDWIAITADGHEMYGFPGVITARNGHFAALPELVAGLTRGDRVRRRVWATLRAAVGGSENESAHGVAARLRRGIIRMVERRLRMAIDAHRVFGGTRTRGRGPLDVVLVALPSRSVDVAVRPLTAEAAVRHLVDALEIEWQAMIATYRRRDPVSRLTANPLLDGWERLLTDALSRALRGSALYGVSLPPAAHHREVVDAIGPLLEARLAAV